jgi:hypothetical protein
VLFCKLTEHDGQCEHRPFWRNEYGTETWRIVWIGRNGYFDVYLFFDVRIRDYFSKPKGVHEQRSLGNTDLDKFHAQRVMRLICQVLHSVRPLSARPSVRYVPCHLLRSVLRTCKPVMRGSCLESFVSSSCKYMYVAFVMFTQFAGLPYSTVEKPARDWQWAVFGRTPYRFARHSGQLLGREE